MVRICGKKYLHTKNYSSEYKTNEMFDKAFKNRNCSVVAVVVNKKVTVSNQ